MTEMLHASAIELKDRLIAILADILQIDDLHETADIDRTNVDNWDSINHLRFIQELEDTFLIEISDEEAIEISSLQEVQKLLIDRGVWPPSEI